VLNEQAQGARLLVVRAPRTQPLAMMQEQFSQVLGVRRIVLVA
jgi:hypothetical protein